MACRLVASTPHPPTLALPARALRCLRADALEAQQARAERHLKEEELGSLLPRLRAAQQLERLPPPPSAPRPPSRQQLEAERQPAAPPGAPEGPASAAMARAAAAAAKAGTAGSGRAGGKVRPLASLQLLPSGSKGPSAEDEAAPAGAPEPASGGFAPQPPLSAARPGALLALRCASCGLTTHQTEQCPLALISPPSLVPGPSCTRKQSLLLFKPLASPSSGASSPGDQLWAEPSPQLFTKEQLLQQGEGGDGAGGSPQREAAAPGLQPTSAAVQVRGWPQPDCLLRVASTEAALLLLNSSRRPPHCLSSRAPATLPQQAFGAYPRLLSFVAAAPAPASAAAFEALADKLCSHISDLPPPLPSSHLDTPVRGWSWCSTAEALRILRQLATMPVGGGRAEGRQLFCGLHGAAWPIAKRGRPNSHTPLRFQQAPALAPCLCRR